ncbi:unnamed protein product, partial [Sphacelaria rigidula]
GKISPTFTSHLWSSRKRGTKGTGKLRMYVMRGIYYYRRRKGGRLENLHLQSSRVVGARPASRQRDGLRVPRN